MIMIVACVLAGMGESSAMISGGVLIGQEALRGAVFAGSRLVIE